MRLPDLVAYQAAVQHPATAFADPELRAASVATGRLGLPRAVAGNFAVTYQLQRGGRRWAVRCFHRDAADRARRYAAISQTLASLRGPFVPVTYLAQGVRVGQTWYPVTKMPWLDGVTLDRAVERRLGTPEALADLERRVIEVVGLLRQHGLAHGDLQHGNMLVEPAGGLRLVDYDGMYVPALRGLKASESGDPNYQHPGRGVQFDAALDRFSVLVIVLALRALAAAPRLWQTYNSGDNLLFRRADFLAPARSALFRDLMALPSVRELARRLADVAQADYARIPTVGEFLQVQLPPQPRPQPSPMLPRHVAVLNRLYGGGRAVAGGPRPATAGPSPAAVRRSWKRFRGVAQQALTFSADGALLITADGEGVLRARACAGGRIRHTWRNAGQVVAMACAADGQRLATVGPDGTCRVWRPGTADPLQRGRSGPAGLASIACGSAGPVIASVGAGRDPQVRLLDLASGRQRQLAARGSPSCIVLAADASTVALGSSDGSLRCWSVAAGTLVGAAVQSAPVTALAISPDGAWLASAGGSPGVHLWQLPGGRAHQTLATTGPVVHLAFAAASRRLAAAAHDGHIRVWHLDTGAVLHDVRGPAGALSGLALSPDGRCVAATTLEGVVWLRELGSAGRGARRAAGAGAQPAGPRARRTARTQPAASFGPGGWLRHWLRRVAAVP